MDRVPHQTEPTESGTRLVRQIGQASKRAFDGTGAGDPEWGPLETLFGGPQAPELAAFMFMGYEPDGLLIYKHGITRRALILDNAANCYRKHGKEGYELVDRQTALDVVYADIQHLRATPTTAYDDAYREARDGRLESAGFQVISVKPGGDSGLSL